MKKLFLTLITLAVLIQLPIILLSYKDGSHTYRIKSPYFDNIIHVNKQGRFCRENIECGSLFLRGDGDLFLKWDTKQAQLFVKKRSFPSALYELDENNVDLITLGLQKKYEQLEYSLKKPFLERNPFKSNPLSVYLRFPTPKPATIKATVKGLYGAKDVSFYFKKDTDHTLFIPALFPETRNYIELEATFDDNTKETTTFSFKTEALPNPKDHPLPFIRILKKEDDENLFYHNLDGVVFDEWGNIRYLRPANEMAWIVGNEYIQENRETGLDISTLKGEHLKRFAWPKDFISFTHGLTKTTDGHYLVVGSFDKQFALIDGFKTPTHREFIIELDHNGHLVHQWDMASYLNPSRNNIIHASKIDDNKSDWCHINSVFYDQTDDSIIGSCRHTGPFKLDRKTGEMKWLLAPNIGFEKTGRDGHGASISDKILTAVNQEGIPFDEETQKGYRQDDFVFPIISHHITRLNDGRIAIYDNAGRANDFKIKPSPTSRIEFYNIDEKNKTVSLSLFKQLENYSELGGSVFLLPDKNQIIVYTSSINDKNSSLTAYGDLRRIDLATGKELMHALIYIGGTKWYYRMEPFDFNVFNENY